jgi:hypothetical protein
MHIAIVAFITLFSSQFLFHMRATHSVHFSPGKIASSARYAFNPNPTQPPRCA